MLPEQLHPEPVIETTVSPVGGFSVTATAPLVDPAEAPLETLTVYVALVCPWAKFPVWDLPMLKTGGTATPMTVTSLAVDEPEPPPETVTWLVTCDGAFEATFTVTVIAG